jgi:glycosyltransferase involved in cell wall biosynthesis
VNPAAKVHVWVPDLFSSTGGIQAFSRNVLAGLGNLMPSRAIRVRVKNDSKNVPHYFSVVSHQKSFGTWPTVIRTPYFAVDCICGAWTERPQLVLSTHLNFGPIARLVKQSIGTPYVLVAHGIDAWELKTRGWRRALREADLLFAVSRFTRDRLLHLFDLEPGQVKILPNTFASERFVIAEKSPRLLNKFGLTDETPVILTVGRLAATERYKGYDQIIRALPQVLREVPNAQYIVVGDGADRDRLEKLATDLGVRYSVTFAGFVADEELCEYYNLCDLFAMPSSGEGFGIVYLEALACGKPVLAGNKDGSRDALADGELGLLVDPDDVDEIASETIRVLRRQHPHPDLYCPEFLRQRVTELFGFETFKKTLAKHLTPFLTRNGGIVSAPCDSSESRNNSDSTVQEG